MRAFVAVAVLVAVVAPKLSWADEATLLAKEHFRRGTKAYDLGHFLEAAEEYEKAYEAKESPALLYNLGQAYRGAGEHQKALNAYRSYLRHVPDAPNRAEVVSFIDLLKKTIEAQKQAQEKPPTGPINDQTQKVPEPPHEAQKAPPPPPVIVQPPPGPSPQEIAARRRSARRLRYVGLGVGGLAIAAVGIGAGFAALTSDVSHEISSPPPHATWNPQIENRGNTDRAVAISMFAIGGAAAVTSAALIGLGTRRLHAHQLAIAPVVGPGLASASLRLAF